MKPNVIEQIDSDLVEIGAIFHEHSSQLLFLSQVFNRAVETLGPNPFANAGEPTLEEVEKVLSGPVLTLIGALGKMIETLESDWQARRISEDEWAELSTRYKQLLKYQAGGNRAMFGPPTLYGLAKEIDALFERIQGTGLPREKVKHTLRSAKEVMRIVCLYDLTMGRARIIGMDYQTHTLRDYLTASVRPKEPSRVVKVVDLIGPVMQNLAAFAKEKRVEFRDYLSSTTARVEVVETDVRRALGNILYNAIKYSWKMQGQQLAWVDIRCFVERGSVVFEFENWGVPIKPEEIEQGLIFKLGYRGELASSGGRLGSGVGLHDALRTAVEHGGEILVESLPAREQEGDPSDPYEHAYITTVKFKLLLHRK